MTESAPAARYRLDLVGLHQSLVVVSFRGTEALSQPFSFVLQVHCECRDITASQLLYQLAFLVLAADGVGVHGQIQAVECSLESSGQTRWQLTLGPRLACLAQRYTPRVFQDMSATQIITRVLAEHGIREGSYRFHLKTPCRKRQFCAQYLENDLQLVQRLCAEEGIHYHFCHSPQGHHLVFGSGLFGARRSPVALWRSGSERGGVTTFTVLPEDACRPVSPATQRAEGRSTLMSLHCGQLLPLSGHPQAGFNQLWRITEVEHCADGVYSNRFLAMPWDAPLTPAAVPAMALPVLLRGWVVGPHGQAARRDRQGRVRVQFEWVMQGNGARFADCWLPVQAGVHEPLCGGMEILASPSRDPGREPQVIACLALEAISTADIPDTPEPLQVSVDTAWLLGDEGVLHLQGGPQLSLEHGAEVTLQVGASRMHIDAQSVTLSSPNLAVNGSRDKPAVAAAQAPGEITKAQAAQQSEEHEGQP